MDGGAFTDFLVKLNAGTGFAGHADWRLPTSGGCCGFPTGQPPELESIVDTSRPGCGTGTPCIDPIFDPTAPSDSWSSSTCACSANVAWRVFFGNATVSDIGKTEFVYVRAMRGRP